MISSDNYNKQKVEHLLKKKRNSSKKKWTKPISTSISPNNAGYHSESEVEGSAITAATITASVIISILKARKFKAKQRTSISKFKIHERIWLYLIQDGEHSVFQ